MTREVRSFKGSLGVYPVFFPLSDKSDPMEFAPAFSHTILVNKKIILFYSYFLNLFKKSHFFLTNLKPSQNFAFECDLRVLLKNLVLPLRGDLAVKRRGSRSAPSGHARVGGEADYGQRYTGKKPDKFAHNPPKEVYSALELKGAHQK